MNLIQSHSKLRLIDDDASVRAGYRLFAEDLPFDVEDVDGPINDFQSFINLFSPNKDAAICDFNLKTKNYSSHNGDEIVSKLYERRVPALLCTRFAGDLPDPVRHRRRHIPVVITPNDLTADAIVNAFDVCQKEFEGQFSPSRKPWRTMIRVESAETVAPGYFRLSLVIPGWDPNVGLNFVVPSAENAIFNSIHTRVSQGSIVRVFGQVNIGAERKEDIYIDGWSE